MVELKIQETWSISNFPKRFCLGLFYTKICALNLQLRYCFIAFLPDYFLATLYFYSQHYMYYYSRKKNFATSSSKRTETHAFYFLSRYKTQKKVLHVNERFSHHKAASVRYWISAFQIQVIFACCISEPLCEGGTISCMAKTMQCNVIFEQDLVRNMKIC